MRDLRTWIESLGGFIHPALERRSVEGLQGIYTGQLLQAGEKIIRIPRSLIIGPDTFEALNSAAPLVEERDRTIYAFLIQEELGEYSNFYPWINKLPSLDEFKTYHPIFATDDEIAFLWQLNPRIVRSLMNFRTRVEQFHTITKERFKFEKVLWASLNYMTRAFDGYGFVPVCDMFNHNAKLGRGLVNGHSLVSGTDLRQGDEVHISYGAHKDSLELWMQFGFIDRASGTVINCRNVKASSDLTFDHECFIDVDGLSPNLLAKLSATSDKLFTSDLLRSLTICLSQEIKLNDPPSSPLTEQAQHLCEVRLALLQAV